jgi:hypothetical protein
MVSRQSAGGRANEAGSLHRSGVGAFLAAYGLTGRGLEVAEYPEQGPAPISISFETGDAVDDLCCDLADGTSLLLQAKRTCGADRALESTIEQWVRQIPDLRPGNFVGLVTAMPQGVVRRLGAALARRRREHSGPFPGPEQQALDAVRDRLPEGTSAETGNAVLDAAMVLTVAASTQQEPDFRFAAALLDGAVVRAGTGSAAVRALQRAFQEQATAGTGSGLDEWLEILAAAGLEVFADAEGPTGPRRRAELDALAAHRQRLSSHYGWLGLSALADDLPPLRYDMLAESFQVLAGRRTGTPEGDRLIDVTRRWPRMLLTGLPGMGKSTAVEQLGARWAADTAAPIPVVVSLVEVAMRRPRRGSDVTLDMLIEIAASKARVAEREPLQRALGQAAARGEVTLILDGLDECRSLRGVVADGLAAVSASIAADAGVLVTTRDSGLAAADKLGFPQARLTEPSFLAEASRMLLLHAARYRVPATDRESWVEQRESWIAGIRRSHPDLWAVPLLAMLLTLLAAARDHGQLPASRAQLLAAVVHDSVARWELARPRPVRNQPTVVRPEILTDGFADIAHAIAGTGACSNADAQHAVMATLTDRWGRAPGEAEATASDIMAFWDDQVGIFVSTPGTGQIEARSRVFSEIGEALCLKRQDSDAQREWIASALADGDRRDTVLLAAGLSSELAEILADTALETADDRAHALLLTADATRDGAVLRPQTVTRIMTALATMAAKPPTNGGPDLCLDLPSEPTTRKLPGDAVWPYARRLAMIILLTADLREQRRSMLREVRLTEEQKIAASALAAMADAVAEAREALDTNEAVAVTNLLNSVTPDRADLLPGYVTAAEQAIAYHSQLGPEAANSIYRIVRRGTYGTYRRAAERLTALGFTDPQERSGLTTSRVAVHFPDQWDDWGILLRAIAEVSPPEPISLVERWQLPSLGTLFDLLDPHEATLDSIDIAYSVEREHLPGWIRATAKAAGLNLPALAAQAAVALTSRDAGDNTVIDALLAPPPAAPPRCDIARLDNDDVTILIEALQAKSEWLADVAAALLLTGRDAAIAERVAALRPGSSAERKRNTAVVIANDPNQPAAILRALDSGDPSARVAAAIVTRFMVGKDRENASWAAVSARIVTDHDVTVRLTYNERTPRAGATRWSCHRCSRSNDLTVSTCANCGRSRRQRDLRLVRLAQLQSGQAGPDLATDSGAIGDW